jgi:selenoprotein W-related protein
VPAGGGCFELTADGDLLYSKLQTGKFPDEQAMVDLVAKRLK